MYKNGWNPDQAHWHMWGCRKEAGSGKRMHLEWAVAIAEPGGMKEQ